MRHRDVRRDNTGFQARSKKRVQNDFADTADLAQAGQKKQRGVQNFVVHHRMYARGIAKVAQVLR